MVSLIAFLTLMVGVGLIGSSSNLWVDAIAVVLICLSAAVIVIVPMRTRS